MELAAKADNESSSRPLGRHTMSCALPEAERYHEWVYESFADLLTGRILEVGAGLGIYTPKLMRHGQIVAADLDEWCLRDIQRRFPDIECHQIDLAQAADFEPLQKQPCDSVVCLNVLEHIEDDAAALSNLRSALRPGGRLILYVPAMPALFGTLDEAAGHFRRYRRKQLIALVEHAGFRVIRARYQNAVSAVGWWLNGRVLRQRNLSAESMSRQIRAFDRYLLPVARVVDPLTRSFVGQSLLVCGEKR